MTAFMIDTCQTKMAVLERNCQYLGQRWNKIGPDRRCFHLQRSQNAIFEVKLVRHKRGFEQKQWTRRWPRLSASKAIIPNFCDIKMKVLFDVFHSLWSNCWLLLISIKKISYSFNRSWQTNWCKVIYRNSLLRNSLFKKSTLLLAIIIERAKKNYRQENSSRKYTN